MKGQCKPSTNVTDYSVRQTYVCIIKSSHWTV